jgi:hypothetical protein
VGYGMHALEDVVKPGGECGVNSLGHAAGAGRAVREEKGGGS